MADSPPLDEWRTRVPEGFEYFVAFDDLPYASGDLAGLGGELKVRCDHFVVTEVMGFEVEDEAIPPGQSFHWWLWCRRSERTTRNVQEGLARDLGLGDFRDVGAAGLKDKRAIATQWLSVPSHSPGLKRAIEEADLFAARDLEVLRIARRRTKLKRGQHAGNAFEVVLSDCCADVEAARNIAARLEVTGVPNYFGQQRFGKGCSSALRGARILLGPKKYRPRNPAHAICVDAFASMLFNIWLAAKVEAGPLEDDLRGPVFGADLSLRPGEADLLDQAKVPLAKFPARGTRRKAKLQAKDFAVIQNGDGALRFTFELEKSAYATVLLREFVKRPGFCRKRDEQHRDQSSSVGG